MCIFNDVFKLTHIAGPGIFGEVLHYIWVNAQDVAFKASIELLDESGDQFRDVF